jgi:hypothetical protein
MFPLCGRPCSRVTIVRPKVHSKQWTRPRHPNWPSAFISLLGLMPVGRGAELLRLDGFAMVTAGPQSDRIGRSIIALAPDPHWWLRVRRRNRCCLVRATQYGS